MKTRQILIYSDSEKNTEYKVPSLTLKAEIEKFEKINLRNAAEKIQNYPESIQKLVWRALYYKCEIDTRSHELNIKLNHLEKINKFIDSYRQTQKLILKLCKKNNVKGLIIEEDFKKNIGR